MFRKHAKQVVKTRCIPTTASLLTPLFILAITLFMCGCASVQGNEKIKNENMYSEIIEGKTDKAQIRSMYGETLNVTHLNDDEEVWVYEYNKSAKRAAGYIPYLGLFLGGTDKEFAKLTLKFDRYGKVKSKNLGIQTGEEGTFKTAVENAH